MDFENITIKTESGATKKSASLEEFVKYLGGDISLMAPRNNSQ